MMITTKLFIVLATLGILVTTTFGIGNVFGQVTPPPLESTPGGNGSSDKDDASAVSLGKATIPVSSGEQIIIDIPFKDGNTYKLVPIK